MPHSKPLQYFSYLILAIPYHQGYRGKFLRAHNSTIPWPPPSIECGLPLAIPFSIVGHMWHCIIAHTNGVKSRLHGTIHNWLNHGHTYQGHSPIEDPTILSCQSKPTPSLGKVVHEWLDSTTVYPHHGCTQCNVHPPILHGPPPFFVLVFQFP